VIPYFQPPSYRLGPFTLEVFGLFAAAGVMLGARLASRRARQEGLDASLLLDYAFWGVVSGVVFGHLVHIFLYHPEELSEPLRLLRVWDGLSSFGGLLGALLAAYVFFRKRGVPFSTYSDAFALGVAPGWGVARLGCFAVHDHPGVRTSFFLAVRFPGGPRHDLGLYDAILLFAAAAALHTLSRAPAAWQSWLKGRRLALLAVMYGVGRFFLDFLRARDLTYVDARYFGLTPAQYACVAIVAWGVYVLSRRPAPEPAQAKP
jgi:phosphatidylglycerol:prolipoprotein diacylglycerol transferase